MQHPHDIHWKDRKMILHYVQGTKHFGVHYAASSPLELVGFTDFDWVGDYSDINSTSCYVFILENGPISWPINKQYTISLFSSKAKYRGAVSTTKQFMWLQGILGDISFAFDSPTVIWHDTKSAINISTNPV